MLALYVVEIRALDSLAEILWYCVAFSLHLQISYSARFSISVQTTFRNTPSFLFREVNIQVSLYSEGPD